MRAIPRNIVSSFLMVLFMVVSITGVMMYFKIRILSSEALHIWLGFAFVALACVHVIKNWSGFSTYFKKRSTLVSIGVCLLIVMAFVVPPLIYPQQKGINPKAKIISTMMNAPLSKLAVFVDMDVQNMVKSLSDKEIVVTQDESISGIAKRTHLKTDDLLAIVFSAK